MDSRNSSRVDRCAPVGHGFWYVKLNSLFSTNFLLSLPFQQFSSGIVLFQPWVPLFNSRKPAGILSPIWVTIKNLPLKYFPSSRHVVQLLGPVYGEAPSLSGISPRFCIRLELGHGLPHAIDLEGLAGDFTEVLLEYNAYKNLKRRKSFLER
jgi:hypothetical protein